MTSVRHILLVLLLTLPLVVKAHIVPVSQGQIYTPNTSTPVVVGTSTAQTQVLIAPTGLTHTDLYKKGVVTFGVDHHYSQFFTSGSTIAVQLEIKRWSNSSLGSPDLSTLTPTMTIQYNPTTGLTFDDKQMFQVDGVEKYTVKITQITVNSVVVTTLPANLYIHADLFIDRIFDFGPYASTAPALNDAATADLDCDENHIQDELYITWPSITAAEEYQVEWVHVNNYGPDPVTTPYLYPADLGDVDFRRNATRVSTSNTSYAVTLAFDEGYIFYRVRAVGRSSSDPTKRIYGAWSSPDVVAATTIYSQGDYYLQTTAYEFEKNWQYSATYAEEGKKKEVVSFFDGTMRNRQSVTKINSDHDNIIVGETIYDHQGRPAVEVLPAPVGLEECDGGSGIGTLRYYPDFNQNGDGSAYNREDFDLSEDCALAPEPMNDASGASNYYSPSNPNQAGQQAYVPDANGRPFTQIEYMPDNTGRIRSQGGVGDEFQLGSGHETKYYYAHPSQVQLDRMFGSEVGDAAHYQKNMVIDGNGQVSVSYLDQEGRVIATSLAGEKPANLEAIPSSIAGAVTLTDDLFAKNAQGVSTTNHLTPDGNSLVFNETMSLSAPSLVKLKYDLDPEPFSDDCLNHICFGCVYDLKIEVTNDCGVVYTDPNIHTTMAGAFHEDEQGNVTFLLNCEEMTADATSMTIDLDLPLGTYQITKTLTVNQDALNFYIQESLKPENNSCVKTLDYFEDLFLSTTDFSDCDAQGCQDCLDGLGTLEQFLTNGLGTQTEYYALVEQCQLPCKPKSFCETTMQLLMSDMSPNGQYGEYLMPDGSTNPGNFPLSVYNVNNLLPQTFGTSPLGSGIYDWQRPKLYVSGTTFITEYRQSDGTRATVEVLPTFNTSGVVTSTLPATVSVASTLVFQDGSGAWVTYPENLANVDDFVNAFKTSWAKSLLFYHPEFSYYKTCLEFTVPVNGSAFSSEEFDALMMTKDTWLAAEGAGFLNGSAPLVDDRITDYDNPANAVVDPFWAYASSYGLSASAISNKIFNYMSPAGTYYSMMEISAMINQGGNILIGASPSTLNTYLNTFGTVSGTKDAEWQTFRSFYQSAKQDFIRELSNYRAVNDPNYLGYNGCIGDESFNPLPYDFLDVTNVLGGSVAGSEFFNSFQPCNSSMYAYYADKAKRFASPLDYMSADLNAAAYQNYLLSGDCPEAATLQHVLNEVAVDGNLNNASPFSLTTTVDAFGGFWLAMNDYVVSAVPATTWNQTSSNSTQLEMNWMQGMSNYGTVRLTKTGSTVYGWNDVLSFANIEYTGPVTGGFGFTINAMVDQGVNPDAVVTIDGFTTFDIGSCESEFEDVCELNELGLNLQSLITGITDADKFHVTTAYQIQGGGAPLSTLVTNPIEIASNGATASNFYWKYDAVNQEFVIYSTATDPRLELAIQSVSPGSFSLANLNLVDDITAIVPLSGNTFEIVCEDNTGEHLVTLTCSATYWSGATSTPVNIGSCAMPTPAGCEGLAYDNYFELPLVLEDVLINQAGNNSYNFFNSPYMTSGLTNQFDPVPTSTYSSTTSTYPPMGTSVVTVPYSGLAIGGNWVQSGGCECGEFTAYSSVATYYVTPSTITIVGDTIYYDSTLCHTIPPFSGPCPDSGDTTHVSNTVVFPTPATNTEHTAVHFGTRCPLELNVYSTTPHPLHLHQLIDVGQFQVSGSPDAFGNYYEFTMIGVFDLDSLTVTDTIFGVSCLPLKFCDTIPSEMVTDLTFPTQEFDDPCTEYLTNIALSNAQNAYNEYVADLIADISDRYIEHCMTTLKESFIRAYDDKEYHRTLYYYDQAGNLIKTIPPEGVELLNFTSYADPIAQAITADRTNGTHNVITSHRMPSIYEYNSLNQLVRQSVPDQDAMDIWEISLPNGLASGLTTNAIQMIDANIGYLSGTITTANAPQGTRGYLYYTENGGANWKKVNHTVAGRLRKVQMVTSSVGFAIGEAGIALKTSDAGATWDLLNTFQTGSMTELTDLYFTSATAGRFISKTGLVLSTTNGGTSFTPQQLAMPVGVSGSIINVSSMQPFSTSWLYTVTISGSPSYDAIFNTTSANVSTIEKVTGADMSTVQYYSTTEGITAGADGNIIRLTTPLSGTTHVQSMQKSNLTGTVKQVYFLNTSRGFALVQDGADAYLYLTIDGGSTWEKIDGGNKYTAIGLVKQQSTKLEIVGTYGTSSLSRTKRFVLNTSGPVITIDNTMDPMVAHNFVAVTSFYVSATDFHYVGAKADGSIWLSNALNASVAEANFTSIGSLSIGVVPKKMVAAKASGGQIHIIVLGSFMSGNVVQRLFASSIGGAFTSGTLLSGTPDFRDIALNTPTSGNAFVLGYNQANNTLYRAVLGASAPSFAALTGTMTAGYTINGVGISNDRVTLVGVNGALFTSTVQVTETSSTTLAWTDRSGLRLVPMQDINPVTTGTNNYIAVGDNGTFLKRITSTNVWNTIPVGKTENLTAVATIASAAKPIFTGEGAVLGTLDLSTNVTTYHSVMNGQTVAQALNGETLNNIISNGNIVYVAGKNGAVLYSDDPATMPFAFVHSENVDFYGLTTIPGQSGTQQKVFGVGSHSKVYEIQGVNLREIKQVFGPSLVDVHFANAQMGTTVGANYFIRQTTDGGQTWKVVLPATTAELTNVLTRVWTKPAQSGGHFAFVGGVNYYARVSNAVATGTTYASNTITDIQFNATDGNLGYFTSGTALRSLTLNPAWTTYTVTIANVATATQSLNALHVFDNGSIMAVGNAGYVGYVMPLGTTFNTSGYGPAGSNTLTDVYFYDNTLGYVTSSAGTIHRGTSTGNNATTHTINGMTWVSKSIVDNIVTLSSQIRINAIAFGTRHNGVWGGVYTSGSTNASQGVPYARRIVDESGEFTSRVFYDRLGRVVVSQNSRQQYENKYSYMLYDAFGRITEAGEKTENAGTPKFASIFGAQVNGLEVPTVVNDDKMDDWLTALPASTRTEVTKTYYDATVITGLASGFAPDPMTQRKRITHVTYEEVFDGSDQTFDHATHYDYDIQGNVKTLLQDNKKISSITDIAHNRFKRLDYNYDLISNKMHRMSFQTGKADQWHHAYTYDADNRIREVYTTNTTPIIVNPATGQIAAQNEPGMTPYWDKDASYEYYAHSPLSRVVIGQERVQGLDYIYTMHGWMKALNSNSLDANRDPGLDGKVGSVNAQVARDAMSYSLHYFSTDYAQIGSGGNTFIAGQSSSDLNSTSNGYDLYNGDIARMVATITDPNTRNVLPLGSTYKYDQLRRLRTSSSFTNLNSTSNTWGSGQTRKYYNELTYDANGNIITQLREDQSGTGTDIDNLTYGYNVSGGQKVHNRLYHLDDGQTNTGLFPDDLEDMGSLVLGTNINVSNNYVYDAEGRLIKDVQEQINLIKWSSTGKIKEVIRNPGSPKKNLKFDYDAFGRRIAKHVFTSAGALEKSIYYILDPMGSPISIYERSVNLSNQTVTYVQSEKLIYGMKRLGVMNDNLGFMGTQNNTYSMAVITHKMGSRNFELSNHLGSVLSVISDKPIPHNNAGTVDYWLPDILNSQDYSPFGVVLYGRDLYLTGSDGFRFGYQGSERDDDMKVNGNSYSTEFRQLDPRVGRWLSIDPETSKIPGQSPYVSMDNNPIFLNDILGNVGGPPTIPTGVTIVSVFIDEATLWKMLDNTIKGLYGCDGEKRYPKGASLLQDIAGISVGYTVTKECIQKTFIAIFEPATIVSDNKARVTAEYDEVEDETMVMSVSYKITKIVGPTGESAPLQYSKNNTDTKTLSHTTGATATLTAPEGSVSAKDETTESNAAAKGKVVTLGKPDAYEYKVKLEVKVVVWEGDNNTWNYETKEVDAVISSPVPLQ